MSMKICFSVLMLVCQQVTHNKLIGEGKTCLIVVTDFNMTSKRALLHLKSNGVTKFNDLLE